MLTHLRVMIIRIIAIVLCAVMAVPWVIDFGLAIADDEVRDIAQATATPVAIPTQRNLATSTPVPIPTPVTPNALTPTVIKPTATQPVLSTPGPTAIPTTAVPTNTPVIVPPTATPQPQPTATPVRPQPTATPVRPQPTSPPPQPTAVVPTVAPTAIPTIVPTPAPTFEIVPTATRLIIAPTRAATRAPLPTATPETTLTAAPTATPINTPLPTPTAIIEPTATSVMIVAPTPLAKPKLNYAIYTKAIGASLPDVSFVGVHVFNEVKLKKAPIFGIAAANDIKIDVRMDLPARIIEAEAAGGEVEMTGQSALLRAMSLAAADDLQFNLGVYAPDLKRLKIAVSDSNGPIDLAPAGALLPPTPRPLEFTSADELGRQVAIVQSGPSALPADPRTPIVVGLFLASALFAIAGTAIGLSWVNKRR